jgi:hypothetical protein
LSFLGHAGRLSGQSEGIDVDARHFLMVIEALVLAVFSALRSWGAMHGRPRVEPGSNNLIFEYSRAARSVAIGMVVAAALVWFFFGDQDSHQG